MCMMRVPVPVVLASSSLTRRRLLEQVIADFEVVPPHVAEQHVQADGPRRLAMALAAAKADEVACRRPDALVIAADTVVSCEDEVIGKPRDRADAVRILGKLTSRPHFVVTGLCLAAPDGRRLSECVSTRVRMRRLSRDAIEELADAPLALEAAGAYRLMPDDPNVESLEGSATCVMGLPLDELRAMLGELYPPPAPS
jgi:septum formation protein